MKASVTMLQWASKTRRIRRRPACLDSSLGLVTNRDAWAYSPSKCSVAAQMDRMISFYNGQLARFDMACVGLDKKSREAQVDRFIDTDTAKSPGRGL